ncbi:hypothetical protein [Deinococcus roseus]|uniref:Uncharacterized protein n=1 Tax=Deinococcus roseus TaxID=392414 RepID=A0ABQ2CZ48_9DEIO|nr:hypothetical protein [Deinococcus roseus]GGJ31407.1 hypothetical protein GCM10008938_17000 [Deinococcus roseus]
MLFALDKDPKLQAFQQSLSKFYVNNSDPQKAKDLGKMLGNLYYHDLYQDKAFYASAREVSEKLCSQDALAHQSVRRSWVRALNALEPQGELDEVVSQIYWSRKSRWERLAKQLKMAVPKKFLAYRAVKGSAFVEAVSRAWEEEDRPLMSVWQESLASWSLTEKAARQFFGEPFEEEDAVLFVAEIPFEQTFMDKFLDGGTLVLHHSEEDLIYAGGYKSGEIYALKERTIVKYRGFEYTFEQRKLLGNILKAGI